MRISDWSSDVCSSDLAVDREAAAEAGGDLFVEDHRGRARRAFIDDDAHRVGADIDDGGSADRLFGGAQEIQPLLNLHAYRRRAWGRPDACRSEEHTSELQSIMRISSDVFCLKQKNIKYT